MCGRGELAGDTVCPLALWHANARTFSSKMSLITMAFGALLPAPHSRSVDLLAKPAAVEHEV